MIALSTERRYVLLKFTEHGLKVESKISRLSIDYNHSILNAIVDADYNLFAGFIDFD